MGDSPVQTGIAVFTGDLGYWVRKGILDIDASVPGLRWLVVVHSPQRTVASVLRSQLRNLRRNGWRWIPHQVADVWHRIARSGSAPGDARYPGSSYDSDRFSAQRNMRILRVADIHGPETLREVEAFAPRLGLSLAAPVLRKSLFGIPKDGTLNLHKGRLPDYRGMPPAFWEFWNGEQEVGCTVHWVDERLDTGPVVLRDSVARETYSSVAGLKLRLDRIGVELMCRAVKNVLAGQPRTAAQSSGGTTYRKPTLRQVAELERRLRAGQPAGGSAVKRVAKDIAACAMYALWCIGAWRLLSPRVTVLLYHRVSDAARDNLTVGVEQFDRQMALLRRHCQVVSIEDIVDWSKIPRSSRPLVCVTFDDGYLDNFENAAPILERHQIPAAFYVSTGIVASERQFPHDIRRGNAPIPVMQWEQLRAMQAKGFSIGSHSVSHISCAQEPEDRVWEELVQSRDDLERELGTAPQRIIFAYPYGGRQHMTAPRLELVRRAGYRACLSAYGGSNVGTVDPFNVLRRGINWQFSDAALLLECLGTR